MPDSQQGPTTEQREAMERVEALRFMLGQGFAPTADDVRFLLSQLDEARAALEEARADAVRLDAVFSDRVALERFARAYNWSVSTPMLVRAAIDLDLRQNPRCKSDHPPAPRAGDESTQ